MSESGDILSGLIKCYNKGLNNRAPKPTPHSIIPPIKPSFKNKIDTFFYGKKFYALS